MSVLKYLLVILMISSCGQSGKHEERIAIPARKISYEIEKKDLKYKPMKASFDVRIQERISKDEIEIIAHELMAGYPGFNRYFIFYWLPDMEIGTGAWATSHFADHFLSINIQGASQEEEDRMRTSGVPDGEIIGKWYDNRPYVECIIIIFKKEGALNVRQIYGDGSFGDQVLKQTEGKYIYPNQHGEYFKIESDGNLGWYSKNGRFAVAKKTD